MSSSAQKLEILQKARELYIKNNGNEHYVCLILTSRYDMSTEEAEELMEIVKQEKTSSMINSSSHNERQGNGDSYRSQNQFISRTNQNDYQQSINNNSQYSVSTYSLPSHSQPKKDRVQLQIRLIEQRVKKEFETIQKSDKVEFFHQSEATVDLCSFAKCLSGDRTVSDEDYREMHCLSEKKSTKLLYLMFLGVDLPFIAAILAKEGVTEQKFKRMLGKLQNHPIVADYRRIVSLRNLYHDKVSSFKKNEKDSSLLKTVVSFFTGGGDDNNRQQKPVKGNNDEKEKGVKQENRTTKKIDLSKMNSLDDLKGKVGSFIHDEQNGRYKLKVDGKLKEYDAVFLRESNYTYLKSKNRLEKKLVGTIDWVGEENGERYGESGKVLAVGAKC